MPNFKNLIDNPHPIWANNVHSWNFLLNSYEGGTDYTLAKVNNVVNTNAFMDFFKLKLGGKEIRSQSIESNMFPHAKLRRKIPPVFGGVPNQNLGFLNQFW